MPHLSRSLVAFVACSPFMPDHQRTNRSHAKVGETRRFQLYQMVMPETSGDGACLAHVCLQPC